MTDNLTLNALLLAISLFNTILLLWLGLTVLLNSDRRAWGIWLGGGGLILGALFFLSHSVILGLGLFPVGWSMILWWTVGLVPALILPITWYVSMLWYAGYWEDLGSDLHRRQRPWLGLMILLLVLGLAGLAMGVFLLGTPSTQFTWLRLYLRWSIGGVPLMALGYSVYVILCIGLSLDALRRPGPSARIMGQLARQRARPWLAAASITLLAVSLLVTGTLTWLVQETRQKTVFELFIQSAATIAWLDLIIASLISVSILLMGQAVVSYEVFTGKTLPRRGLARHWGRAIIVAAGYGLLVGGGYAFGLRPLYVVLLATLLMTIALALISWRSYAERERYIEHLRPFLTSQHLYDHLLAPEAVGEVDIATPFATLCAEVLGARLAYLAALGPLAPLAGRPLSYPAASNRTLPALAELSGRFQSPETMTLPVDPASYGGAMWAVPLWSQRGLIGVLLLGEKRDGGLYAQEEMEIARISCERLIDTQASAELGRRLMALQRETLVQSQMSDLRARQVLHDEVLPNLQAALIKLEGERAAGSEVAGGKVVSSEQTGGDFDEISGLLSDSHRLISDLLHEIPTVTTADVARLGFVRAIQRAVDGEYRETFDEVKWRIEPEVEERAGDIPAVMAEVLFYAVREAVRNAARHGRSEVVPDDEVAPQDRDGYFCLQIDIAWREGLEVVVEDNGVGLGAAGTAGTNSGQGLGHGLALYSTMMAIIGGTMSLESEPNQFTRVRFALSG